MKTRAELDQFVVNIEFLLISVIQGVALGALASVAGDPIRKLEFQYFPYIISAFILILNFWAQAIIHTLSFIDWPLDLPHNFLYFLVSFIEVLTFSHLTDPLRWFGFISLFFVVAAVLYIFDYLLIKQREKKFQQNKKSIELYQHIQKRQKYELSVLLPTALIFNMAAFVAILLFPMIFLQNHYHILLACIQLLFGLLVMINFINNFKKRAQLISEAK